MVNAYFLDSSALVKRYVAEIGSGWVQAICDPQMSNGVIIARIAWAEVLSAFARLQREGKLNSADMASAIQIFRHDLNCGCFEKPSFCPIKTRLFKQSKV